MWETKGRLVWGTQDRGLCCLWPALGIPKVQSCPRALGSRLRLNKEQKGVCRAQLGGAFSTLVWTLLCKNEGLERFAAGLLRIPMEEGGAKAAVTGCWVFSGWLLG